MEKHKFSLRLNEILDEAGFPDIGQGRQTAIADMLDVQPELVGEWLKGSSYPKTAKLVKLAKLVRVRSNWLLSGVGDKYSSASDAEIFRQELELRFPEKFKRKKAKQDESRAVESENVDLEQLGLNQDAINIACAYMKLPVEQKSSLKTFLLSQADEH